ncbi:uncharacterized protein LOC110276343 isoform X1 [Arachis duranensis]|uniref:Uncharacterized protein LOC110276343 isoform X1 n=1 Tax=Arachis duranensis TaxID=130453 RepID=A0A6P5MUE3_ARADU|nr:uncharacterized protein LOC110276343 isoform X1 [Arachis duranensis]XP_025623148.1 uncharacterized protein LOC112715587 isoform X2 [Arachis hypogaea]
MTVDVAAERKEGTESDATEEEPFLCRRRLRNSWSPPSFMNAIRKGYRWYTPNAGTFELCRAICHKLKDNLGWEKLSISVPSAMALTADLIASLVDTTFIGRIGKSL